MPGQRFDSTSSGQQQARDVSAGVSGCAGDHVKIFWHRATSLTVIANQRSPAWTTASRGHPLRFRSMKESNVMDRPLEGIRVVELAMWVAGPSTSAVLGDWGADVIKLEDPRSGDPIRGFVTRTMGDPNARIRPPFELDNRNKRGVTVDLRNADGHVFALKLIERADVFVTSLRLDAIERMRLDYATLSAKNPRLVYASINGYGHRGPDRNRPA